MADDKIVPIDKGRVLKIVKDGPKGQEFSLMNRYKGNVHLMGQHKEASYAIEQANRYIKKKLKAGEIVKLSEGVLGAQLAEKEVCSKCGRDDCDLQDMPCCGAKVCWDFCLYKQPKKCPACGAGIGFTDESGETEVFVRSASKIHKEHKEKNSMKKYYKKLPVKLWVDPGIYHATLEDVESRDGEYGQVLKWIFRLGDYPNQTMTALSSGLVVEGGSQSSSNPYCWALAIGIDREYIRTNGISPSDFIGRQCWVLIGSRGNPAINIVEDIVPKPSNGKTLVLKRPPVKMGFFSRLFKRIGTR